MNMRVLTFGLMSLLLITSCGKKSSEGAKQAVGQVTYCPKNSVKLSWDAPTEREDGRALDPSEIQKYIVYWGTASINDVGTYSDSLQIAQPSATEWEIDNLDKTKTYYFAIKAVDTTSPTAYESNYSEEIKVDLAKAQCPSFTTSTLKAPPTETNFECKPVVKLNYSWPHVTNMKITEYQFSLGYRRDTPSEIYDLPKDTNQHSIQIRRGKTAYALVKAVRDGKVMKQTIESQYKVLTCAELQKKLEVNPNYTEILDINMTY